MRLGFLGVGSTGRERLQVLANAGATIVAVADPSRERRDAALATAPGARACEHFGQLLEVPLDGVVIATPTAYHADHCLAALERGLAVFCRNPLARTGDETRTVIDAARARDRLLGVDLAYRHTAAARAIAELVSRGELGRVYAIELQFHSAHGPDVPWHYNKQASGGGCVIDLGLNLVDLALWLTGFPEIESVSSLLRAQSPDAVEEYATVQLELAGQISVRLACSWRLPAGRDCIVECSLYGTGGGASLRNVDGSFHDFVAERYRGTQTERLVSPPDAWGGRAAVAWLEQLRRDRGFDPDAEDLITVADALDAIYGAPCAS